MNPLDDHGPRPFEGWDGVEPDDGSEPIYEPDWGNVIPLRSSDRQGREGKEGPNLSGSGHICPGVHRIQPRSLRPYVRNQLCNMRYQAQPTL